MRSFNIFIIISYTVLSTITVEASDIVTFGFCEPDEKSYSPVPTIFITEGDLPKSVFYTKYQKRNPSTFAYAERKTAQRGHPDNVADVVFQVFPRAKISGASLENPKKKGVFNHSYGASYKVGGHGKDDRRYSKKQQNVVNVSGHQAFGTDPNKHPLDGQLHVIAAGNEFVEGIDLNSANPALFNVNKYEAHLDYFLSKFGRRVILCSQMREDGMELNSFSCRPTRLQYSHCFISCPMPVNYSGTEFSSGTSFAAPMVCAVLAKLAKNFPSLTYSELADITLFSAAKEHIFCLPGSLTFKVKSYDDIRYGRGLLSLENAYALAEQILQIKDEQTTITREVIHENSLIMLKQAILYPKLDPARGLTTFEGWLGDRLPNLSKLMIENLAYFLGAIKYKEKGHLKVLAGYYSSLIDGLSKDEVDYMELTLTLRALFNDTRFFVRTHLRKFFILHLELTELFVVNQMQEEILCRYLFEGTHLKYTHRNCIPEAMLYRAEEIGRICSFQSYSSYFVHQNVNRRVDINGNIHSGMN